MLLFPYWFQLVQQHLHFTLGLEPSLRTHSSCWLLQCTVIYVQDEPSSKSKDQQAAMSLPHNQCAAKYWRGQRELHDLCRLDVLKVARKEKRYCGKICALWKNLLVRVNVIHSPPSNFQLCDNTMTGCSAWREGLCFHLRMVNHNSGCCLCFSGVLKRCDNANESYEAAVRQQPMNETA